MSIFEQEEIPLFSPRTARRINAAYRQDPLVVPISSQPTSEVVLIRPDPNWLPIVGIVSIVAFFGFLAFLAFMRRS